MTVWISQRCENCGQDLTGWVPEYFVIDRPYLNCPKCGAVNDRSRNATEWELMGTLKKAKYFLLMLVWGVGYGIGGALAGVFLIGVYLFPTWYAALSPLELTWLTIGLTATGISYSYWDLRRAIRRSRARMAKKSYRYLLVALDYMAPDADMDQRDLEDFRRIHGAFARA
ncbi:MAG: hypothetical protein ACT4OE_00740 [Sphingosinicella sp.]